MSKLELTSLNCTNCGASIQGYEGLNDVQCEYCNTSIKVLRPRSVNVEQGNLSGDNFDKLNNYVEILQKAIRAGNYNEGYDYCNKALEVNPNIGSIWENKAICAFWRSISFLNEDKITISNAREIRTFLSASKENDPNSETYELTADAIGSNLATVLKLKMSTLAPDVSNVVNNVKVESYSFKQLNRMKDYFETMETAFEIMINKDVEILKFLVNELSNHGKILWWKPKNSMGSADNPNNIELTDAGNNCGLDVAKKREMLIKRIKVLDPTYVEPNIKIKTTSPALLVLVFVVATILFFLLFKATLKN